MPSKKEIEEARRKRERLRRIGGGEAFIPLHTDAKRNIDDYGEDTETKGRLVRDEGDDQEAPIFSDQKGMHDDCLELQ